MNLELDRIYKGKEYTIGKLYIDGSYICDTLEDTDRGLSSDMDINTIRSLKVKGKTAIPYGTYSITLDITSPKYSNYSKYPWAKEIQGKIPRLLDVKGYEGILIHVGNTAKDTDGCILVGENGIKGQVLYSRTTFIKLYRRLKEAYDNKESITIKIK